MKTTIIKYVLILFVLIIPGLSLSAQAVLSTSSNGPNDGDPSAALEIDSDNSGLLIPTIILDYNDAGDIVAPGIPVDPADGLLIFYNGTTGIDKGLYYYDAAIPEWVIYSDFTSTLAETGIEDFGEMHESNDFGAGTHYALDPAYSIPWATASIGLAGSSFHFLDNELVVTETGTADADQLQINGQDAVYAVIISATLVASAPSTTVTGRLYKNDVKVDHIFFRHTFQLKDKPTSLNTGGNVEIHDGDKIDFRFTSDVKNKGVYLENLNVRLTKMGDL